MQETIEELDLMSKPFDGKTKNELKIAIVSFAGSLREKQSLISDMAALINQYGEMVGVDEYFVRATPVEDAYGCESVGIHSNRDDVASVPYTDTAALTFYEGMIKQAID